MKALPGMSDSREPIDQLGEELNLARNRIAELESAVCDLKRREEVLCKIADIYDRHFSIASDVLYAVDARLRIMMVSPGVENALGYRPDELIGKDIREIGIIHPEDVEKAVSDALRIVSGDKTGSSVYRFFARRGDVRYGEVRGIPLMENGRISGVVALARDVTRRFEAQEKLRRYQDHLERLVEERTAELTSANESLRLEIEERKRTEAALRASEAKYRMLYDGMEDGFIIVDLTGRILEFNEPYRKMTGYDPDELRSLTYMDITPPRWHEYEAELFKSQILVRGYSEPYEKEYIRKDGTVFPIELRTSLVRDEHGNPSAMWAIVRDITERKRAEDALRESERRFRDLAENTSDLIWETDENLRFTYMSRNVTEHLGYDPEDRLGRTLLDVIPEQDAERLKPFMASLRESPRAFHNLEYRAVHHDGTLRIREASGVPIYDGEGRHKGFRGVTRDITERRKAEDRIVASEKKFSAVFHSSPVPMVVSRPEDGTIVDCNLSCERWIGYTREELIGHTTLGIGLWLDAHERDRFVSGVMEKRFADAVETVFRVRDGTIREVLLSARLIDVDEKTLMLTQVIDITERKKAEKKIQASEKKFSAAFNSSPAPMVMTSLEDGTIMDANQACQEWSGYTWADAVGRTTTEMGFWQEPGRRAEFIHEVVEKGSVDALEMRYINRSGEVRDVLHSARLIEIEGRQCLLSHIQDITEKKKAEKALMASEERLRGIANNFPGVVFQFYASDSGEMGVHYLSERTMEIMGLGNDTWGFLDRFTACIAPEDRERFYESVREAIRTKRKWDYTCRFMKPGGEEIYVQGISQPVRHEDEAVFSGVLFDITRERLKDEELERHRSRLEEMVLSRTSELTDALKKLTKEIETRKKTEETLRSRETELRNRGIELEEMNAALKVLLRQREEDRSTMEMNIVSNMKAFVLPHIEKLEAAHLADGQMKALAMVKTHLQEITSPFTRRISSEFLGLTPSEIQVASLIRDGKTSKEISRILNISLNTVHTYRFNIRKKTGLKNNKINLRSYLKTLE